MNKIRTISTIRGQKNEPTTQETSVYSVPSVVLKMNSLTAVPAKASGVGGSKIRVDSR